MAKGVPTQRAFLRWFHAVEDDPTRETALRAGYPLIEAAIADGLIDTEGVDGFAGVAIQLHDQGYLASNHPRVEEWGIKPRHDLQQAQNLRSTEKGRSWLDSEPTRTGTSFTFHGPASGQFAGRDVTNVVTLAQLLDLAEARVDELAADDGEREGAHRLLEALRGRGADVATSASGGLVGRVLAELLGLAA